MDEHGLEMGETVRSRDSKCLQKKKTVFYGHDRAGACMNSERLYLNAQDRHKMEQDKITVWIREELMKSYS